MRRLLMILLAGAFAVATAARAAPEAALGGDLQAQILYAFHTEDINRLNDLAQTLETRILGGDAATAPRYHLAHADYRLGLLYAASGSRAARSAFTHCVDELKPLLVDDAGEVEALLLQSACLANRAGFHDLGATLDRARATQRLDAALKRAPDNPRGVYLKAMEDLARAPAGSAQNEQAFLQLQRAAQLFATTSATNPDVPGWGDAQAYLDAGRQCALRGDVIGARNWIERSLLAAPDYKAARQQLAVLQSR